MGISNENRRCCLITKFRESFRRHLLFILTLSAVIVGFTLGFTIRLAEPTSDTIAWLGMPGELFLRLLKMMIIPLLVCSVIHSTASLDPKSNGKISAVAFTYILLTNILGCVIAIALFYVIKPGSNSPLQKGKPNLYEAIPQDIFADLLRNIIPDNIVEASFRQTQTKYTYEIEKAPLSETLLNVTYQNASTNQNMTTSQVIRKLSKSLGKTDSPNMLGLITACMFLGTAAGRLGKKAKPFLDFFAVSTEVVLQVLRWFLWMTPLGISSLIAASIASTRDVTGTFSSLGLFVLTVTIGIVLHQALFIPMILFLITRRNPFTYFISIGRAWLIGFAATSTAVAIPEMLQACENKNRIDKRISRFVIPFCVTLNADGSALFITAAAMFIANITGQSLTFGEVVIVGLLTAIASLALPSVPSSSIVTLIMVLSSLNIPVHAVSLLFAVEWFLDRIRTTSNVLSHTVCAAITHHFCHKTVESAAEPEIPELEVELIVHSSDSHNQPLDSRIVQYEV
uniref:Amino acid transporter n=1 Tax=Crassostrea virginica TaxID=6565 RepID=A0A8B8EBD9_CRAVI|nr:excitatory amino acid transporter-like [Crassostrea virginica]XP_022336995.1 excitatory amino acid transporter-like [Crassostrea virginica]